MDFFDRVDENSGLPDGLRDAHADQTMARKKSSPADAPGQRILKWLTWGLIAVLLVYGLALTTAHVLARMVGIPRAQIVLAQLYNGKYWWHPTDRDYAKGLLRQALVSGDLEAQFKLARDYENEKNYTEAFPLHRDLALRGWAGAQKRLGVMYLHGRGVSQNTDEGIRWIRAAAAQEDVIAHLLLGALYSEGLPGLPQDLAKAAQWFQSAYLCNEKARNSLLHLYEARKEAFKDLGMAMYGVDRSLGEGYASAKDAIQLIQSLKGDKK